ncbi:MAG: hypothetical protein JWQ71_3749 [Pedosphaera sp.]|nr:hypothetical protein [Pedosphaera sp.]
MEKGLEEFTKIRGNILILTSLDTFKMSLYIKKSDGYGRTDQIIDSLAPERR